METVGLEQAPDWSLLPLVVFLIGGDPIGRKGFLCCGYVDLPVTDHVAHQPFEPILCLGIPSLFDASSRLWPEIGRVVRAAQTKRNKMVNLVIRMRSGGHSVSFQYFVTSLGGHRTPVLFGVSTCGVAVRRSY